ncbi:beta-galactosidase [Abditibacteriota bacterium]|nr:beta-galactosidase [Abditibacteriota bacterium]
MISQRFAFPALLFLTTVAGPSFAQNLGRVTPASLPLPLPGTNAVTPNLLRARNPWNLPVMGTWKFKLMHGSIKAGQFQPEPPTALVASSSENQNPPSHAFDDSEETRWCANGADVPQWLEADLGKIRHVQSIALTWEKADHLYQYRIQGRKENKGAWTTLASVTAPGVGNGPATIKPADVRYIRITVLAVSENQWASIREFKIGTLEDGQEKLWHPPVVKAPSLSPAERDAFAAPTFADAAWDNTPVPSNWEMLGYSVPTYNTVDNTVGLYRRTINVPATWAGRRIYWRFDGALDGAEIFVNGQKAGYHESGYTAFDVDVTGLLKPGQSNLLAVRVSKTTPSYEADTGDYQSMGGIYRDTSLIAVPQTHVHDITVQTPLAPNYRDATLNTQVQVMGKAGQAITVNGRLLGSDGKPTPVQFSATSSLGPDGLGTINLSAPVTAPKLWSAEKPNLYYVVLQLSVAGKPVERVEQRFGFRQIEVKNNVVLWNGRPIKCMGICRHDFWSDKGFALTDVEWNKDLTMMKAANINAVRTSHYNHAARFLELCDEKGMYIMDEVPYCWIGDGVKTPEFLPYLQLRARETLGRDKNRPCVVAWSLGNENEMGPNSQTVLDMVKGLDPTRPAFVSSVGPDNAKGQDWRDEHYPGPDTVERESSPKNVRWPYNYTEHPHTFYEKEIQDYDPGVSDLWSETLIKTWDMLWPSPHMLGSFIWEWQGQGVADKNEDKTREFWFGQDHLRQENNKGIVDGYRNPKPEWWIVKMAYSPVVVGTRIVTPNAGTCTVPLTNHYSFTDLKELSCRFVAMKGAATLQSGTLHIPCGPMQTVQAHFPAPSGMTKLRLEFTHPDGTSISSANLLAGGATPPPAAMTAGTAMKTQDGPATLSVSNNVQEIIFDKKTGSIRSWRVANRPLLVGSPILNLGEAENEGGERGYFQAKQPPVTNNAQVTSAPGADGAVRVTVTSNVLNGVDNTALGTLTTTYDLAANTQIGVNWKLDWTAPDVRLWESGLKLPVPTDLTKMSWSRDSYFADYPAGHLGEPEGTCKAGDVSFRASKRSLHWLTLTNATGFGIVLLPQDQPLLARANPGTSSTTLFASREVANRRGLSGSWVDNHNIDAKKDKPLSGAFILRAIGARG